MLHLSNNAARYKGKGSFDNMMNTTMAPMDHIRQDLPVDLLRRNVDDNEYELDVFNRGEDSGRSSSAEDRNRASSGGDLNRRTGGDGQSSGSKSNIDSKIRSASSDGDNLSNKDSSGIEGSRIVGSKVASGLGESRIDRYTEREDGDGNTYENGGKKGSSSSSHPTKDTIAETSPLLKTTATASTAIPKTVVITSTIGAAASSPKPVSTL